MYKKNVDDIRIRRSSFILCVGAFSVLVNVAENGHGDRVKS